MLDGWIKLHRQIISHKIWLSEKFTDGQAWIDLLLLANHQAGMVNKRGIRLDVPRGFVGWSELNLGKRWKWSRGKVRRFFVFLVQQNMIETVQQNNKLTTLIKIVNYDQYQDNSTIDNIINGTTDGHQTDIKRYRNKNNKKEKNKTYTNEFLDFWEAYPKKVGKDAAWKAWNGRDGDRPEIGFVLNCLEQQKLSEQWIKKHGQFIPYPSTWLNQGRWADEIPKQKGLW